MCLQQIKPEIILDCTSIYRWGRLVECGAVQHTVHVEHLGIALINLYTYMYRCGISTVVLFYEYMYMYSTCTYVSTY